MSQANDSLFVVCEATETSDTRGRSFSVPAGLLPRDFLLRDSHVMTIAPGAVRGDHYHRDKREIFIVSSTDAWSLHWYDVDVGAARRRDFMGTSVVFVVVPPLVPHAIRNHGRHDLQVVAIANAPYDPAAPDAHRWVVSDV